MLEMDPSKRGRARPVTAVLWMDSWEERGSVCAASARRENKSLLTLVSMEQEGDFSYTVPLIVTAVAVILATLWVKLRSAGEKQKAEVITEETEADLLKEQEEDKEDNVIEEDACQRTESATVPEQEVGTLEELPETKDDESDTATESGDKDRSVSSQSNQEEENDNKEEDIETESDNVLKISEADDADDEDPTFKYHPGKLRGSDYEKMLTKDELEEEQRIELTSDLTSL